MVLVNLRHEVHAMKRSGSRGSRGSQGVGYYRANYRSEKIVFAGEVDVGKTTLFHRLQGDKEHSMSLHSMPISRQDTFQKAIQLDGGEYVELTFWDTGGVERYQQTVGASHYHGASLVIFVFSVVDSTTLHALSRWVQDAKAHEPRARGLLLGNKTDVDDDNDAVSEETERSFAEAYSLMRLRRTSAMTGEGVGELLDFIVDNATLSSEHEFAESTLPLLPNQSNSTRRKCCA